MARISLEAVNNGATSPKNMMHRHRSKSNHVSSIILAPDSNGREVGGKAGGVIKASGGGWHTPNQLQSLSLRVLIIHDPSVHCS